MKQELKKKLKKNKQVLIIGAAGTGKTYLISEFVKDLEKDKKILVLAPTHKALKVLKQYFEEKGIKNITFKTISSALKLKPRLVEGEITFLPYSTPIINNYDLVIVDEASMIKKSEALLLLKEVKQVIFAGDKYQLPPINEEQSIIFDNVQEIIELKEIKRQSDGNPIIEISKNPENFLDFLLKRETNTANNSGFVFCSDKKYLIELVARINNPNIIMFMAYRNKTVNSFNLAIKKELGIKEQVTTDTPIIISTATKGFESNTVIKPKKVKKMRKTIFIATKKKEIKKYFINYFLVDDKLKLIANESIKDLNNLLRNIKHNEGQYLKYYSMFTKWDYAWGITVHKSQGSSYQAAIIDLEDILKSDIKTRKSLAYVALTRARILNIIT